MRTLPRALRHRLQRSETSGPVLLAVLVGMLAGAWAILFRGLIALVEAGVARAGVLGSALHLPGLAGRAHLVVAPAAGIFLAAWVVRRWAPEAGGFGVPEVQHAVQSRAGRIRPRVTVVKAVASALTIGSGGSAGREGPIVQMGSALGSLVGQVGGLGADQRRLLIASGAAGAVGATFNAPIAGVIFALEGVLRSFAARSFGLVVISSVSATALSRAVLGPEPAFHLARPFALRSETEFVLYLLLGVLLGLLAVAYIRVVYGVETQLERWRARPEVKAVAGGLAVGVMGLVGSGLVLGVGYAGVERALSGELAVRLMLALVVLKMVATAVTVGAGGSGGLFAPALFVGAMAGGAFGQLAGRAFPTWTAEPGAYAIVGMAALFGAAAHAPVTAVLILFEMTDDYQVILPLMLAVGVSYLVKSRVFPESMYSIKLRRLGGPEGRERETSVLDLLLVADAMQERFESVRPDTSLEELLELSRRRRTRSWPVIDEEGHLVGIVTETDFERPVVAGSAGQLAVRDVMTTSVITLRPDETLREAFRRFAERDVQQIPVVEDEEGRDAIGVLRRHEMVWVYRQLSREHDRLLAAVGRGDAEGAADGVQRRSVVRSGDARLAGRRLRDVSLPPGVLVTLVRRGGDAFVPRGDTRLLPGDELQLLTTASNEQELDEWLVAGQPPGSGSGSR